MIYSFLNVRQLNYGRCRHCRDSSRRRPDGSGRLRMAFSKTVIKGLSASAHRAAPDLRTWAAFDHSMHMWGRIGLYFLSFSMGVPEPRTPSCRFIFVSWTITLPERRFPERIGKNRSVGSQWYDSFRFFSGIVFPGK